MESNEQTELTSKIEKDSEIESRLTAQGRGWYCGVVGSNKKDLRGTDNSVVIVGGRGADGVGRG